MPYTGDARALTFDLFGTVLDLGGSLTPYIADFLSAEGSEVAADEFWEQWRYRQRLEQFQDTRCIQGPLEGAKGPSLQRSSSAVIKRWNFWLRARISGKIER